jgi:hypothetical protein
MRVLVQSAVAKHSPHLVVRVQAQAQCREWQTSVSVIVYRLNQLVCLEPLTYQHREYTRSKAVVDGELLRR